MAGVNREYVVPGNGRDITVRLSEASAQRVGARPVGKKKTVEPKESEGPEAKEAPAPKNKARTPRNK